MKAIIGIILLLTQFTLLHAQKTVPRDSCKTLPTDTIVPGKGTPKKQLKEIKKEKVEKPLDSTGKVPVKTTLVDTIVLNKYSDLLYDDTAFNKRYPLWVHLTEVAGANVMVWSIDRDIMNADFSMIRPTTRKYNLKKGWEWDTDRFGINFIDHTYSGTMSFNTGRANDYNFFQSASFSTAGSLMREYFGENTSPSYNDIINTLKNGAFLGEILHRLSSNILDDRTRGIQRVSREVLAGIIDPIRGLNRILQGKTFRGTNKEVYQKEHLNISLYTGLHIVNDASTKSFASGAINKMIYIQFDYGNPFENRLRKPFDLFKLRTDFSFGAGRKIPDKITCYGILIGTNKQLGKQSILLSIFQYYDYIDNKTFEQGTIAFGGGAFSKLSICKKSDLYTNIHIVFIPFAGNSTHFGPDNSQVRDYSFGAGLEAKFESTLNLGDYVSASLIYYYYFVHTYMGLPGNNYISIFKPRVPFKMYKGFSIGLEQYVYYNNRYMNNLQGIHSTQMEQKIFIQPYQEDKQRRGHYNLTNLC